MFASKSSLPVLTTSSVPLEVQSPLARGRSPKPQTAVSSASSSAHVYRPNAVSAEGVKPVGGIVEMAMSLPLSPKPPAAGTPALPWRSPAPTFNASISLPTAGSMTTRPSRLAANSSPSGPPMVFAGAKDALSSITGTGLDHLKEFSPEIETTPDIQIAPEPSALEIGPAEAGAEDIAIPIPSSIDSTAFLQVWETADSQADVSAPESLEEVLKDTIATVPEESSPEPMPPLGSPVHNRATEASAPAAVDPQKPVSEEEPSSEPVAPSEDKESSSVLEMVLSFLIAFCVLAAVLYFVLGVGTVRSPQPAREPVPNAPVPTEPLEQKAAQ